MMEYLLFFDNYANAFVKTDLKGKNPQIDDLRFERKFYDKDAVHRIFIVIKFHRELIQQFARENDVGSLAVIEDYERFDNPICVGKYDTDINVTDETEVEFPHCQDNRLTCDWSDWCRLSDKKYCTLCQEKLCDKTDFCKFD